MRFTALLATLRCRHAYPVSRSYGGKPKYYLVQIADHPDADWLINDLMATVEGRLFVISQERDRPGAITGFVAEEDRLRIETLRKNLGEAGLKLLASQPGETMTYEKLCLALRDQLFGKLKKTDYSKVIKQLYKEERVLREANGAGRGSNRARRSPCRVRRLPATGLT